MKKMDIPMEEFMLNIKYQNIQVKDVRLVGYEWDKGIFVFTIIHPNVFNKKEPIIIPDVFKKEKPKWQ